MQRSNIFLKVISAVILLALVCYMGLSIYRSVSNPFKTALAVDYSITHGYDARGMTVRSETVLPAAGTLTDAVPKEGEKVSNGGLVAVEYSNESVFADANEIETLETQIAQMEEVLEAGTKGTEVFTIDSVADDLNNRLQNMLVNHDFSDISKLSAEFRTLTYYSDNGSWLEAETKLAELKNRLYELRQKTGEGMRKIYSESSGVFSETVDGFEFLTPAALADITVDQLEKYLSSDYTHSGMGKLVSGVSWYFAALVGEKDAKNLRAGETVHVRFDKYYGDELKMTVDRIGNSENGNTVVVFSCSRAMSEMIAARKLTGKIISETISGIRVPKKAVKLDEEGRTCVYTLTGAQAELKYIEILEETGDYYIVRSNIDNTSALRAGDEIIVSAKNLYDGKVVK